MADRKKQENLFSWDWMDDRQEETGKLVFLGLDG